MTLKGEDVAIRIHRDDASDLGFVMSCYVHNAIGNDELSQWASRAIDEEVDPPLYLYEMLDWREHRFKVKRIIGFTPSSRLHDNDWKYLTQISKRRGFEVSAEYENVLTARISAKRKVDINRRFLDMFGIDVDDLPVLTS